MRGRANQLFAERDLRAVIDGQVEAMLREIDACAGDRLASDGLDVYCASLLGKYGIVPIALDEGGTKVAQEDVTIDARDSPHAMMHDLTRPVPIPATKVCFYVPFSGEKELFECRPSSFTTAYPCGRVQGNELLLEYTLRDHDAETVKASFNRDLQAIKQYVEWIANDLAHLPARLEREARARIEARQAKLRRDVAMLDALGFPKRP